MQENYLKVKPALPPSEMKEGELHVIERMAEAAESISDAGLPPFLPAALPCMETMLVLSFVGAVRCSHSQCGTTGRVREQGCRV